MLRQARSVLSPLEQLGLLFSEASCSCGLAGQRSYASTSSSSIGDGFRLHKGVDRSEYSKPTTDEKFARKLIAPAYTSIQRPKAWATYAENLARRRVLERPVSKNRRSFDRYMDRQTQIMRDAHKRKEGAWRNQEIKRAEAHERWALRAQIAQAEAKGTYCFEEEYTQIVEERRRRASWAAPPAEDGDEEGTGFEEILPSAEDITTFDTPPTGGQQGGQKRRDYI